MCRSMEREPQGSLSSLRALMTAFKSGSSDLQLDWEITLDES
jgi:hypothetical protein